MSNRSLWRGFSNATGRASTPSESPSATNHAIGTRDRAALVQVAGFRSARIARYGFYPKGGGAIHAAIEPWRDRKPLALAEFAPLTLRARAYVSARLSPEIGEREIRQPRGMLNIPIDDAQTVAVDSGGPGNAFCLDAVGRRLLKS